MKAVVCTVDGCELTDVADPTPADDEVIVEVDACGLCGSDVHAIERGYPSEGQILGYEFAGRIAATGSAVTGWRVGEPVAVNPLGSCGACRACVRGVPFGCAAVPNIGLSAPGAYARYVAVPHRQLVALPPELPVEMGAHAEPLAVALNAVAMAKVGPGDAALVYGVGPIGLNTIMALRLSGVERIVAAGRSPGRRAAAAAVGADEVIDTREITVSGLVRVAGGTCVELSLSSEVVDVSMTRMVAEGLRLTGSCAFTAAGFAAAVDHIASGRAPVAELISERVSLAATPDALTRLRTPGQLVRVLTKPSI